MMNYSLKGLCCQHCRGKFRVSFEVGKDKIFKCSCFEYPLIKGILYLKKDKIAKNAVRYLKEGKKDKALKHCLNVRKKILIPIYFLTHFGFFKKKFSNLIGFNNLISLLQFFSYDKAWVKYLTNRTKEDYFNLSIALSNLIKNKNDKIIDIGVGVGQYLPEFYKKIKSNRIIGLDSSFLNLFLARNFYARGKTLLLCCNVEDKIPFDNNSFDLVHMNDTFHHIRKKDSLLQEIKRVLKKEGVFVCIHSLKVKKLRDIFGISPRHLKDKLSLVGLKKSSFYSDDFLWQSLRAGETFNLRESENLERLGPFEGYSLIASEKELPDKYIANIKRADEFRKGGGGKLVKEQLKDYNNFLFVSPHLDDAILSCTNLIRQLISSGRGVTLLTVFTKASNPPYSSQAKDFLRMCGYRDAKKLFKNRIEEDKKACRLLGVNALFMGFIDAAWRRNKDGSFRYPDSTSQFSGVLAKEDKGLIKKLRHKLRKKIDNDGSLIFAPLGVGGHADHIIVREAVKSLKKKCVFWEDFPYNTYRDRYIKFFKEEKFKLIYEIKGNNKKGLKDKAIKYYKSQFRLLFPHGKIPGVPERYFIFRALKA